jgi:site-specific recombinase XerD
MSNQRLVYQYLTDRRAAQDLAAVTIPNVRWTLLGFMDWLDDLPAGRITPAHIEGWMASMNVSRSTARNRFSHVRLFCRWLIRRGHLKVDPTLHLKAPKQPRPVPRGIAADEIRVLVRTLPDSRARLVVVWMIQLGLRAVELTRLEVGDIDFDQRSVLIRGKGGWQRLLPITEEAWSVLVSYLVEHPARAGFVLRSFTEPWKGLQPSTVVRLVSRWMRDAEVMGTGHALRHSTATHLLRGRGVDVRDVQTVLGHQSLTSTSVYLPHSDLPRLREIMEGRRYVDPPAEAG